MSCLCPDIKKYIEDTNFDRHERKGWFRPSSHARQWSVAYKLALLVPTTSTPTKDNVDAKWVLDYIEKAIQTVGNLRWSSVKIGSIDFELTLTPFAKTWDYKHTDKIGRCEVNSGETEFKLDRRIIRIWRREDWSKVTLHELLHAFMWDRFAPEHRKSKSESNESNESKHKCESEALVEAMAVLLHCQLIAPNRLDASLILQRERDWMLQQANILYNGPKWRPMGKTAVYSYYILKAALLGPSESFAAFQRWLGSPSEEAAQKSWPELVKFATTSLNHYFDQYENKAKPTYPADDAQGRMKMRMTTRDLPISPHR